MKNLAGVKQCDITIQEELYLAGIEEIKLESKGEVPFTIAGRIGYWTLERAWYYWIASVERRQDGLILKDAIKLHEKQNPIDPKRILGDSVRTDGFAGGIHPIKHGAEPVYNKTLEEKLLVLGYEKVYSKILKIEYVPISVGEISKLCEEGKLDVEQYVNLYHIDDQIGLNEFKRFLESIERKENHE